MDFIESSLSAMAVSFSLASTFTHAFFVLSFTTTAQTTSRSTSHSVSPTLNYLYERTFSLQPPSLRLPRSASFDGLNSFETTNSSSRRLTSIKVTDKEIYRKHSRAAKSKPEIDSANESLSVPPSGDPHFTSHQLLNTSFDLHLMQQYPMYPPLGTIGSYGESWFPEHYRNNLRNRDRSSTDLPSVVIRSLDVPEVVRVGDNLTLTCDFLIRDEKEKLYTVNWWRDQDQFFNYNEEKRKKKSSYRFDGITVDEPGSSERSVTLVGVTEATSGCFKCEVMAEAPAFKTAVMYKNITVIVPPARVLLTPSSDPLPYQSGDLVKLTCTAEAARPPVQLSWRINDDGQSSADTISYPERTNPQGFSTTQIGLELVVPQHFERGVTEVSCVASVNGHTIAELSRTLRLDTSASAAFNSVESGADRAGLSRWGSAALCSALLLMWHDEEGLEAAVRVILAL